MSEPKFCALCGATCISFDRENHAGGCIFYCLCSYCKKEYTLFLSFEEEE